MLGVETVWESPAGIWDCGVKLAGKEIKVSISEGHPLGRCLVTTQFSSGRLPLRLTEVLLQEETGVRLSYLGDAGVILEDVGEFVMAINLTTDLPSGAKLQNIGFEYIFIPEYLAP